MHVSGYHITIFFRNCNYYISFLPLNIRYGLALLRICKAIAVTGKTEAICYDIFCDCRDIDNYCQMLENMGRLNIRLLGYNFMVTRWYRTNKEHFGQGNGIVTGFDWNTACQNRSHSRFTMQLYLSTNRFNLIMFFIYSLT